MSRMIFINLPVADLDRAVAFYQRIGAARDDRFCDASAAMVAFSDNAGLELSVLDLVAPLSELALRPAGDYAEENLVLLDAVRPRLGVWLAVPQLSRRLELSAGVGARLVGLDATGGGTTPLSATYVRRASITVDAGLGFVF